MLNLRDIAALEKSRKEREAQRRVAEYQRSQSVMSSKDEPVHIPLRGTGASGWSPQDDSLETPMFSPDDLIGTGIGKPIAMGAKSLASMLPTESISKGLAGLGAMGKIVYHGSPHKFAKFDKAKIGTGEGAQAYGSGLYLAENPEVAKSYQTVGSGLSPYIGVEYQGTKYGPFDPMGATLFDITKQGRAPTVQKLQKEIERHIGPRPEYAKKLQEKLDFVKSVNPDAVRISGGNLYKADIPDEAVAKFLDWDRPLSEQGEHVRKAFGGGDAFPEKAYKDLAYRLGGDEAKASEHLLAQGVPGIRYADAGSRGSAGGTSNFVAFDPDLIRILERNGEPTGLKPWAPGEWGAEGTGQVTEQYIVPKLLENPDLMRRLDLTGEPQQLARGLNAADRRLADRHGIHGRADIQSLRDTVAMGGLEGVLARIRKGGYAGLPAAGFLTLDPERERYPY